MKGKPKIQLALWVLLFVAAFCSSAYGADGQIKISQPTSFPVVINQPGSYVLTSNIVVSIADVHGISITADNVTLDLNGHALIGPGKTSRTSGHGIYVSNRSNVAVINGTVRNFGGRGVRAWGQNTQVKDIRAYGNGYIGIEAWNSIVTNCSTRGNGDDGIYALSSTVTNCTAYGNDDCGIYGSELTVSNCSANSNNSRGISVVSSTLTNCTAYGNGDDGIWTNISTITNCTVRENGDDGIYGEHSIVTNCTVYTSTDDGIEAKYANVTNCTVYASGGDGIEGKGRCRIEGNNLRSSGGYGLNLSSVRNYAIKNVAGSNTSGNFYASGAATANYMPTTGDNANYGW